MRCSRHWVSVPDGAQQNIFRNTHLVMQPARLMHHVLDALHPADCLRRQVHRRQMSAKVQLPLAMVHISREEVELRCEPDMH